MLNSNISSVSKASYFLSIYESKLDRFYNLESSVLLLLNLVLANKASASASVYKGSIFLLRALLLF